MPSSRTLHTSSRSAHHSRRHEGNSGETDKLNHQKASQHPKRRLKKRKKRGKRLNTPRAETETDFSRLMPPPKIASTSNQPHGLEGAEHYLKAGRFTTGGSTTTAPSGLSESTAETSKFEGRNGARFDRADVQNMLMMQSKRTKKEEKEKDEEEFNCGGKSWNRVKKTRRKKFKKVIEPKSLDEEKNENGAVRSKHKMKKRRRKGNQHIKDTERMEKSANPGFRESFFRKLPMFSASYKGVVAVQPPPSDPEDQMNAAPINIPFFRKSIKTPGTDLGAYEKGIIPESPEALKAEQEAEEEERRIQYEKRRKSWRRFFFCM